MDQDAIGGNPPTNRVTFPYQLHVLLSDAERQGFNHIISWLPSGESFVISQPNEFAKDILPRYFRQTKFSSFKRQLNAYGFQREQTEMLDEFIYSNKPNFIRVSPEACHLIRRRRVIHETNMLSLVEARRSSFQTSEFGTLPSSQASLSIEARTAHAMRTAAADNVQARRQQEAMQSAINPASRSGISPIVHLTDPILDDMAASIAYAGDEYNIGEWDPSKEECESPS